jgi:hypothetical protein
MRGSTPILDCNQNALRAVRQQPFRWPDSSHIIFISRSVVQHTDFVADASEHSEPVYEYFRLRTLST